MGLLIDGKWSTDWYKPDKDGNFVRSTTSFRNKVGEAPFEAERDRYHLYVSYACPWASRVLALRKLKKLEDVISVSVVHPLMFDDGWEFKAYPGSTEDPVNNARFLRDVYTAADDQYTGRVTVPVLWDKKKNTIVNNESREIIRFLETAFDEFGDSSVNLAPVELQKEIDAMLDKIYEPINNGVYKSGFATSQKAYDKAVTTLFSALDECEEILSKQRYLCGSVLTEADICLFVTLVRFDLVYYVHFKCDKKHIYEYSNLFNFVKDIYQTGGISDTVNFDHIRNHYYQSHTMINPHGIVPLGPEIDYNGSHDRDRF